MTPCPICRAPYGFHDRDPHGLRIPADWEQVDDYRDGPDVVVVWLDADDREHETVSRLGHTAPLAPWARSGLCPVITAAKGDQ